jgi:hypothetical protein
MKHVLLAIVLAGCADPAPQEKIMKLELETSIEKQKNEIVVTASLRNSGKEPARILVEEMLYGCFAVLRGADGKEIPPSHNEAAARGVPFYRKPLKVQVLKPGKALRVGSLILLHSQRTVRSGDLSWESDVLRSDTLTAELVYEVAEGHAETARHFDERDIAVGRWGAKPVTLTFMK